MQFFWPMLVLAAIQGVADVMPISASAHRLLASAGLEHFGAPMANLGSRERLALDLCVHLGVAAALLVYFWREALRVLGGIGALARGKGSPGARLTLLLLVGTVPAGAIGAAALLRFGTAWHGVEPIAWSLLVFGLLLYAADRYCLKVRRMDHMGIGAAAAIGLAQVAALLPGVSRPGIAMTVGRLLGYERLEAARFALLLSVPASLGAAGLAAYGWHRVEGFALPPGAPALFGVAFAASWLSTAVLMMGLRRFTFGPYAIYRVIVALLLFYLIYVVRVPLPGP
jgi:undecaprenyl-diphosphatase